MPAKKAENSEANRAARRAAQGGDSRTRITLTEAAALGRALEQAVQHNNAAEFAKRLDLAAMVEHGMPENMRGTAQAKEVTLGILSTLSGNLLNNLSAGDYRFLSVEETPEGATAHMRLIPPDGSLNYHRLTIGRNAGQQPVAVDVYVYVTGEPLSHTLGRMVGQLSGGYEADSLAVAQGMQRASSALQAGKPATAEAILSASRLGGRNKKASCKCASWRQRRGRTKCRPASRSAMRTVEPSKLFRPRFPRRIIYRSC